MLVRVRDQGNHAGIVQLRRTHLSAEPPFVEYEYIPGGDLTSIIPSWQALPAGQRIENAARLIHTLAGIVGFAHRVRPKAIVHRDLKPANVLVQAAGKNQFAVKLADFGIGGVVARHNLATVTSRGALATIARGSYTPLYASPEQRRGEDPDPRDDVHALGVVWLHLLTCDLTLEVGEGWRRELAGLPLPAAMLDLLSACISQRAAHRPADGSELEARLGSLLGAPKVPPPPPPQQPPPAPPSQPSGRGQRLLRLLQGFDQAHEEAREAMKRYEFAEAVRILETIPVEHSKHAEHALACRARDRRAFLDPAIDAAEEQHNLLRLRILLAEALEWMPQRPDLVEMRKVVFPRTQEAANSLGMRFAFIPQGKFPMGSPENEQGAQPSERPLHEVEITRPFYYPGMKVSH